VIFTSHPDLTEEVHLWLDDMAEQVAGDLDEDGTPESRTFEPTTSAMCGEEPDLHGGSLTPASETWASNVMDLLGTTGVCEECRTRVALYYDMADEVTLDATSDGVPVCPECESIYRTATLRRVYTDTVDGSTEAIATRHHGCDECGHEWETDVVIE